MQLARRESGKQPVYSPSGACKWQHALQCFSTSTSKLPQSGWTAGVDVENERMNLWTLQLPRPKSRTSYSIHLTINLGSGRIQTPRRCLGLFCRPQSSGVKNGNCEIGFEVLAWRTGLQSVPKPWLNISMPRLPSRSLLSVLIRLETLQATGQCGVGVGD